MKDGQLSGTSSRLTQELFDILRCFCGDMTTSEVLDPFTQLSDFQAWETQMSAAFQKAFILKLQFESCSLKYDCRWPVFSDGFSSDTMLSVKRTVSNAEHGTVWLCLRPSVLSRRSSSEDVVMKANVILV